MTIYIVTIKKDRLKKHNPKKKLTGECRHDPKTVCTDCTGEHHSFLHLQSDEGDKIFEVQEYYEARGHHVTRVEMA